MCTAIIDKNRIGWTREDWQEYAKKDRLFGETFMQACMKGNKDEVDDLLSKASEYHFPDNLYWLINFSSENFELYLHVVHHIPEFYQYDSIS